MKAVIRVPTVQFGYIELELDNLKEDDNNVAVLIKAHNEIVEAFEKTKAEVQKLKDDNF